MEKVMEQVHDPQYDDIEQEVDALFELTDLAIHALYMRIIESD
jgi:hypothetical protein